MDNWENRDTRMICLTCRHFVMKLPDHNNDAPEFGRCRKHAPTLNGFPAVFGTDWCGDHKLNENKI